MTRRSQTSNARPAHWHRTILFAAALVVLSMLLAAPAAHAQTDTARCTFFEIQASNDGKGVDPKLDKLKKKLLRPMFSEWSKFVLLAKHDTLLSLTETTLVNLVSGKLSVMYKEYAKGKKERFKLRLTIIRKNGKRALGTDFTVYAGDYLLISMPTKQKGRNYILGATCKE